ncbi:MAG: hypothetical protein GY699_10635 [Desulfobacteraceae bacterium]|nr:hypothetical protein [Desulfobacteraceae bacterium]
MVTILFYSAFTTDLLNSIKQKKQVIVCLTISLMIAFISCNLLFADTKPLNIAMILWRGETKAEHGFKDGLRDLGYPVQYRIEDAGQDRKEVARVLKQLTPKFETFHYIYTFGTTVSRTTRIILNNSVPQIFNVVTDPVAAGIVNSIESSGGNISGVSDSIPVAEQIKRVLGLINFKKIGIIFNPREKNSMIIRNEVYNTARVFNFEVIDLRSPPANKMLQNNLQKLIDKSIQVDAVYLPADSFIVSNAELIASYLRRAKIISIGATKEYIEHGVLMGFVVNYYQLGKAAAKIVDRHQKGEMLQTIPIEEGKNPYLVINKTTCDLLNIPISDAVLKEAILFD